MKESRRDHYNTQRNAAGFWIDHNRGRIMQDDDQVADASPADIQPVLRKLEAWAVERTDPLMKYFILLLCQHVREKYPTSQSSDQ
jgi:hypothetical protein